MSTACSGVWRGVWGEELDGCGGFFLGPTNLKQLLKKPVLYVAQKLDDGSVEVSWNNLTSEEKKQFSVAMTKELDNMLCEHAIRAATRGEVDGLSEKDIMGMRWVLIWKTTHDPTTKDSLRRAKGRLVILGYQHPRLLGLKTASPTASRSGKHLYLSCCAIHKLSLESADASSAFLQTSANLEGEDLYARPPPEVAQTLGLPVRSEYTVIKILKAIYGLTNARRLWYIDISLKLTERQWIKLGCDKRYWILTKFAPDDPQCNADGYKLIGQIITHADDFLIAGDLQEPEHVAARDVLRGLYRWGKWEIGHTVFAGVSCKQLQNFEIRADMKDYIKENVHLLELAPARKRQLSANTNHTEMSAFRTLMGTLQWTVTQLILQLAVDVSLLLSNVGDLRVEHLMTANQLARDVRKCADQEMIFPTFGDAPWTTIGIVQYCDAAKGNRPNCFSTGGLLNTLLDGQFRAGHVRQIGILNWRSFKLPRKVAGSNSSEGQALAFGEEMLRLSRLSWAECHGKTLQRWELDDVVHEIHGAVVTDSRGIYDASKSESPQKGLRSAKTGTELDMTCEELIALGTEIRWNHGGALLADSLTKRGYPARRTLELLFQNQQRCPENRLPEICRKIGNCQFEI